jgi:hypothetical protein
MDFIYTPASGGAGGFVGAAVIDGTQALCAMVDEVKYTGNQPDVGHAMSYPTTPFAAEAGEQLALPLMQRGTLATGMGDTSGIQIFNPHSTDSIYVDVEIRNQMGTEIVVTEQLMIPALRSATVYAMAIGLRDGFQGSAMLTVYGGTGRVVAASNNVNYAVQYDGSAAYPLVLIP